LADDAALSSPVEMLSQLPMAGRISAEVIEDAKPKLKKAA
jgi:hypothetical protein